jgi:murein DD-endopeptidase MepM/ murein hydrolase activator NlpD
VVTVLPENTKLEILKTQGDWLKVKVGNKTGFVHKDYVKKTKSAKPKPKNTTETSQQMRVDVPASTWLNVRKGPWGEKIGKLQKGDKVEVISKTGDWCKIKQGKKTAFVHKDYLTKSVASADKEKKEPVKKTEKPEKKKPIISKGWGGTPVRGRVSSPFGWRSDPFTGARKMHYGIDVAAPAGTPCKSMGPGKIIYRGWIQGGGGNTIKIQHKNGYVTTYCHLKSFNVKLGQQVGQNSVVAFVNSTGSSTGNHLHFEIRKGGRALNPKSVKGLKF